MAITLDTTVGGASANAYCSQAEANAYHLTHPYVSVWVESGSDQKDRAIATATQLLDQHIAWNGYAVNDIQSLQWPRSGCLSRSGYLIQNTIVPPDVKRATAELARQLLAADRTADNDIESQGITSLSAGSVSLAFDQAKVKAKVIPDAVASMIDYLGRVKARATTCVALGRS